MSSYCNTTSYNSSPNDFNFSNKEFIFVLYVLMIHWLEPMAAIIKKDVLPLFVNMKALLFSI
jgi:hypothetical protein